MRCRACDTILEESEIRINKKTGQLEDLCRYCHTIAFAASRNYDLDDETLTNVEDCGIILDDNLEPWV